MGHSYNKYWLHSISANLQMGLTSNFNCQEWTHYWNHEEQWKAQEYLTIHIFNNDLFIPSSTYISHKYLHIFTGTKSILNPLTPNGPYSGRTAPLTSKRCILYIYSTNIVTEYFKHSLYSPFFFLFKIQFVS